MDPRRSSGSNTTVESGIGLVRGVVTVLTVTTVAVVGPSRGGHNLISPLMAAGGIGLIGLIVEVAHHRSTGHRSRRPSAVTWLHGLDLVLFTLASVATQIHVVDAAWALLVIPMVLASIRFGHRAVVTTWLAASGIQMAAVTTPTLNLGVQTGEAVGQVGVLLAVTAALALLARWLQEGWLAQADQTRHIEARLHRLTVIEKATATMRRARSRDLIPLCLDHVVLLGFDAATATRGTQVIAATGRDGAAPPDTEGDPPPTGEVQITDWVAEDRAWRHSARILEPASGLLITAWSHQPIGVDSAQALGDLIGATTTAIETAGHLDRIEHEATHDPLTDLANHRDFHRRFERAAAQPQPVAVLCVDLDRFKKVNDTYGHNVGDKLLVVVARRLRKAVGDHGLVGRVGGDEFVVLLTGPPAHHAGKLGRDLTAVLGAPVTIDGHQIQTSASIGVAYSMGPVASTELMKQADAAAYQAKAARARSRRSVRPDPDGAGPIGPSRYQSVGSRLQM